MTRQEAKAKALELWPENGHIFDRVDDSKNVSDWRDCLRYWVGTGPKTLADLLALKELAWISGNGDTWEEAFANAKEVRLGA